MSRRTLKAGEAIRQVVSMAILTEIQDPRVRDVTVLHVEVSGDMQIAKVHVSIMGDDTKQKLCMRGLQSSAGFLQSKIAKRIDMRFTPKIEFVLDKGVKNQLYVSKVLDELLPKKNNDNIDNENDDNDDNIENENIEYEDKQ
ncbi:MAG: 30S ribosome-binding factor RbfA [Planctomycetaceae bacterium]|jgi:ribosome-binding factor A|nr:30S ribosome-binding factor RbfA [Planctomycetaceae bacterium]